MKRVTAGFIPLLDAAILIAAREKGFAEEQGIDLHLVREIVLGKYPRSNFRWAI